MALMSLLRWPNRYVYVLFSNTNLLTFLLMSAKTHTRASNATMRTAGHVGCATALHLSCIKMCMCVCVGGRIRKERPYWQYYSWLFFKPAAGYQVSHYGPPGIYVASTFLYGFGSHRLKPTGGSNQSEYLWLRNVTLFLKCYCSLKVNVCRFLCVCVSVSSLCVPGRVWRKMLYDHCTKLSFPLSHPL